MRADRYVKCVLTVIAVALVVIAVRPWLPETGLVSLRPGAAEAQSGAARYEVTVPKAWGKLLTVSNNNLVLESADGIRFVDVEGRPPEYPKVKVLVRWQ